MGLAYDPLIMRDPRTFEYRPGLAAEWKPSNELRTWTFKLRSGVKFHEGWGEMTAGDVKFTVEQNLKPDVPGGSAPFFRGQLERIETPDKLTVVMHFKNRVWEVPSHFTQFVGYQNITSRNWKIPAYDPDRAKRLLAEAGHAGGFEMRVNPMVMVYALDGPDVTEAVALDWEKIGIKVKRVPEAISSFISKNRTRKTGRTHWTYGSPPFDEPSLAWQRAVHSKGAFNILADGPYDGEIDGILTEIDPDKRLGMTQALGQKLYDQYHGVMLGVKSTTWAVSKKVGSWPTLGYVPMETNYEYVSAGG